MVITEFNNVLIGFIVHEAKTYQKDKLGRYRACIFYEQKASVEGSKITGVTKIEGDNVLLILDLESVVQDLGLYEPDTKHNISEIENFSGLASYSMIAVRLEK